MKAVWFLAGLLLAAEGVAQESASSTLDIVRPPRSAPAQGPMVILWVSKPNNNIQGDGRDLSELTGRRSKSREENSRLRLQ